MLMMLQLIGHVDFMIEYTQYNEGKKISRKNRTREKQKKIKTDIIAPVIDS